MPDNGSGSDTQQSPATMRCRVCNADVPTAAFCGSCGAPLFHLPGGGPDWLRVRAYAAAPEEQLPRLSVISTLFPQLTHRSRPAFRTALAALVLTLLMLALEQWQAALIAVSALGVPTLFTLAARQSGAARDLNARRWLLIALSGAALGVAWTLVTGPLLARSHPSAVLSEAHTWIDIAVPVGGALLMLVPTIALRIMRPPSPESVDGYLIGAAGAMAYTAAAVLTRTAPQLATGLMARDRSASVLLVQGLINGIAMPVTAAAAGGLVGVALWFISRRSAARIGRFRRAGAAVAVVTATYAALALVDSSRSAPSLLLGWHLLVAVCALLALRTAVHLALLHEAPEVTVREPVLCNHCRHVVPEMAFCPNCGVAHRASSRTARAELRVGGATRHDDGQFTGDPRTTALFPAYATPGSAYVAPVPRDSSRTRLLLSAATILAAAVAATATVSASVTPAPVRYSCPPDCGRPPIGLPGGGALDPGGAQTGSEPSAPLVPVQAFPRYTSDDGKFSVEYFPAAQAIKAHDGVIVHYPSLSDGEIRLFEVPAHNRTPLQVVQTYIADRHPTAQTDYEIPNAMVGYEPGYGEVDDFSPDNPFATYRQGRILVMAAVRHGLALVATAEGPKEIFTPKNSDHPSAVNLMIANALGASVNSFTWTEASPK